MLLPVLLLAGCAVQVYSQDKSLEQTRKDIKICTDHGNLVAYFDRVKALNAAYDCLERKGYTRTPPDQAAAAAQ